MESNIELKPIERVCCSVCREPSPSVASCMRCLEFFCEVCSDVHYENLPQEVCRLARARVH